MVNRAFISDRGVLLDGEPVPGVTGVKFEASADEGPPFKLTLEIAVNELRVEAPTEVERVPAPVEDLMVDRMHFASGNVRTD